MRDPKSLKIKDVWFDHQRNMIAQLREKPNGKQSLYLVSRWPMGMVTYQNTEGMRLTALREAVQWLTELYEQASGKLPNSWLEELLDYIYAEMNRRYSKGLKK